MQMTDIKVGYIIQFNSGSSKEGMVIQQDAISCTVMLNDGTTISVLYASIGNTHTPFDPVLYIWPGEDWDSTRTVKEVYLNYGLNPLVVRLSDGTLDSIKNLPPKPFFLNYSGYIGMSLPVGAGQIISVDQFPKIEIKKEDFYIPVVDCTCDSKLLVSYGCQCDYSKNKNKILK